MTNTTREALLRALAAYADDEDRYLAGKGEPFGSVSTEAGMIARQARDALAATEQAPVDPECATCGERSMRNGVCANWSCPEHDAAKKTATEQAPAEAGLTVIDIQDDDALRFACRVLSTVAPETDRNAARDMLMAIRTRVRRDRGAITEREPAAVTGGVTLTRSIIYNCPALKLPQTFLQQLGATAQIVALKGADEAIAQSICDALNAAAPSAPKQAEQPAVAQPVYLVVTGETHEGQETYTRHDTPPPLCEFERLYTTHTAPAEQPATQHGWVADAMVGARLRRVALLAGIKESALPGDDEQCAACAFSVLGMIARALDATQSALTQAARDVLADGDYFWLWRNGDHFLAFRHLYPCYSPGGDPMTLGEPVGKAVFRVSHDLAASKEQS